MAGQRFVLACRILRQSGKFGGFYGENRLPGQRKSESPIDWLVRLGLAPTPQIAAEMLILGAGCTNLLNELEALADAGEINITQSKP
jgi:hypothetical protein